MTETVAPLLLVLGRLDLYMDHPPAPDGERIETALTSSGWDWSVASRHISYRRTCSGGGWTRPVSVTSNASCKNFRRPDEGSCRVYRHWTCRDSTLYDRDGEVLAVTPHPFGAVPIVRCSTVGSLRCRNIGQSRYESIAERQREYYNRDLELILSRMTQAHPLLQGPEDFVQSDGTIPIGPSWLLPKKKNTQGGHATYEGFDVVDFPKDGAESIRKNKADIRDDVDRDSGGEAGGPCGRGGVGLVEVGGFLADGNNRLAKIAKILARTERVAADLALLVLGDGGPADSPTVAIEIVYPADFDLFTAGDVASAAAEFQALAAKAGALPLTEGLLLGRLIRLCLPGMSDAQYAACDGEITAYLARRGGGIWAVRQVQPSFG